jgi:DNA helicase HerA-like ATPase
MPKYRARYGASAIEKAGNVVADILSLLDHRTGDWILLRYLYVPCTDSPQSRLQVFLRAKSVDTRIKEGSGFPGEHMLSEFYKWTEVSQKDALGGMDTESGYLLLIHRAEEMFHDPERDLFYYAPLPFPVDLPAIVDKVNLDALLHSLQAPCLIDITAKPVEITQTEGQALLQELKDLDRNALAFDPERRDTGSIEDLARHRDLLASRHRGFYQQYFEAFYAGRICEFGIRVLSQDRREGALVARSLAEALGPNGKAQVRVQEGLAVEIRTALTSCEHFVERFDLPTGVSCYSERLANTPKKLQSTLEEQFSRAAQLSHICCLADVGDANRLLRLPTSDGVYLRTIRIESEMRAAVLKAEGNASGVRLGDEVDRPGAIDLGLDQIQKHLFVAGVTGCGKTTTILNLLAQLWEEDPKTRIPFLVFEPVKSEYRALLNTSTRLGRDLRIYTPGNERLSPFRFNPLEVPPGVAVEEHISSLETCFAGAIPMLGGPLPYLISEAIVDCYKSVGLGLADVGVAGRSWPTMKSLVTSAEKIMETRGYAGELRSNLKTAIDVRLRSLCERSVGRMFSSERSFPIVDDLLKWPTIVEMDALNLDQQNLLVLFLLTSIRERLTRQGRADGLRHVIVLEEAHNLIGVQSAQGRVSEDFADPRGHAARFMVRMLAEIRAFGEGIMVVDQSPAAIAPEVLKNTSVKIVHRTVSEDDRDALAAAMLMDRYAHEELARLEVGEAFVYNERLYRPTRVRCASSTASSPRPDDIALLKRLSEANWFAEAKEARLDHLRNRLDRLMDLLRTVLVHSTKQIGTKGFHENMREWQTSILEAAKQTKTKVDAVVADAMLDRTIRSMAIRLGHVYIGRMQELLRAASVAIQEGSHGTHNQE